MSDEHIVKSILRSFWMQFGSLVGGFFDHFGVMLRSKILPKGVQNASKMTSECSLRYDHHDITVMRNHYNEKKQNASADAAPISGPGPSAKLSSGPDVLSFPLNSCVPFSKPADCQTYEFMNSINKNHFL